MATIEKVKYIYNADTNSFVKNISNAEKSNGNFTKSVGSSKKALLKMSGAVAGVGFGVLAKEIFQTGLEFESMNQSTEKALKILTGSDQIAKELQNSLKQVADSTQFDLGTINDLGVQLLNAGVNAKDVPKRVIAISSAVGALGGDNEKLKQASLGLTQAYQKQKLQGQDIKQIQEAGIPIVKELAKAMNVQEKDVLNLASAGKIGTNEMDKLFEVMAQDFKGGADIDTVSEKIANMKTQLAEASGKIVSLFLPVIEKVVEGITFLADGLDNLSVGGLSEIGEILTTVFAPIIEIIKSQFSPILEKISFLFQQLLIAILPVISALESLLIPVIQILGNAISIVFSILAPIIDYVLTFVVPVISFLAQVLSAILVFSIEKVRGGLELLGPLFEFVANVAKLLAEIVQNVLAGAFEVLKGVLEILKIPLDFIKKIFSKISELTSKLAGVLKDKLAKAFEILAKPIEFINNLLSSTIEHIKNAINSIGDFAGKIGDVFSKINPFSSTINANSALLNLGNLPNLVSGGNSNNVTNNFTFVNQTKNALTHSEAYRQAQLTLGQKGGNLWR